MALPASGQISIDDIVAEFGGSAPDGIEEYYRGGGLVTENNTNVPACSTGDCPIDLEDFYGAENIFTKVISANQVNLVLSDLFTQAEWTATTQKEVVINAGVQVGSNDPALVSCRTGTTIGGQPMAGSLHLINNGFIYGAGGVLNSGVGGNAFQAQVALSVTNNSRIYAGGGGGGVGGIGATVFHYPDTTAYQYFYDGVNPATSRNEYTAGTSGIFYHFSSPTLITTSAFPNPFPDPYDFGGYTYERGAYVETVVLSTVQWDAYRIRRRLLNSIAGGAGGNGGQGIGYNQAQTFGDDGSVLPLGRAGGHGGAGGNWGASGTTGNSGQAYDPTWNTLVAAQTAGVAGGLAGFYIVGNSNVTWLTTGQRLGRVS